MRFHSIKFLAAPALAGFFIIGAAPTFAADDASDADAQIQSMTVQLKELDVKDKLNAATAERGQSEALVTKARSIIGERKERDVLAQTLEEAEATISLAEGKIIEAEKKAMLDAQKQELAATKTKLEALEAEQADLDQKLGGGA